MVKESTINNQNIEIIELFEPNVFKLRQSKRSLESNQKTKSVY